MELWHVLNRGVEKRDIFLDNQDRVRFVHDLFVLNSTTPASHTKRIAAMPMADLRSRPLRVPVVDVHGWCLMGNHYHLLLSERGEGGLTKFIRKLNIGYAKYFNERYERSGTLFQGRTKKILIDTDAHFLHILHYIHLNPLDFLKGTAKWRERTLTDHKKALAHLEKYRWSSYNDYCGRKNFPSILTTELFSDVFGNNYEKELRSYLRDIDIESIQAYALE